jgi:membrane-bound ClpP family serine protease
MFELIAALTVIGALLIFLELFVPGMIAGVCGALALIAALALTYSRYGIDQGNTMLSVVLVASILLFFWWMRAFPNTRFARRWMLNEDVPPPADQEKFAALAGSSGRALTTLRPAGTALIDDRRVDVVAESEVIEAGANIRVVRVEGAKVVVRQSGV